MENNNAFVDLLIEGARNNLAEEELDNIVDLMLIDGDVTYSILNQIKERVGYQPDDVHMKELKEYADDVISSNQYIDHSRELLKDMIPTGDSAKTIKQAIAIGNQNKRRAIRNFIHLLVYEMKATTPNIHRDSIIYDIMGITEKDNGMDVVMYAKHHGEEMIRSKYISTLEDIVELSESAYVNEGTYDNFKKFKEVTRPVNTKTKSVCAYNHYKKPYSNRELEVTLRNIYLNK